MFSLMLYSSSRADSVSATPRRFSVTSLARMLFAAALLSTFYFLLTPPAHAQDALTLTITPPLIQVNLDPGQTWGSFIRVVNGNAYDMTVYADPVPFSAEGEGGRPRIRLNDRAMEGVPTEGLAGWIDVPRGPLPIGAEKTLELPFTIRVPADAQPGGQYAAVLIGNRPGGGQEESSTVSVASSIASLILLTVSGDIDERGRIRDFVTERSVYERPEARFSLRFENQGNVHLQPQGDIVIYNMFGKERGRVSVGQNGQFGNVLPGSIRNFSFAWDAESGAWDVGRYRAETTFAFGSAGRQFASATVYFWVLPIARMALLALGTVLLFSFLAWSIRAYVRRALMLEALRSGRSEAQPSVQSGQESVPVTPAAPEQGLRTYLQPLKSGIVDLRAVAAPRARVVGSSIQAEPTLSRSKALRQFVCTYRYFFLFIAALIIAGILMQILLGDLLTRERTYHVDVLDPDESTMR